MGKTGLTLAAIAMAIIAPSLSAALPTVRASANTPAGQQEPIPVTLPNPANYAAPEPEFTPLDAIDRVRKEGCGVDQFYQFLGWYTLDTEGGGWLSQVVWTNYLVKVGSLANPADPGYWVNRQDYLGQFRITSFDYRASFDPAIPVSDSSASRVTLTRLDERHYRVNWHGGTGFAGVDKADQNKRDGAYIFEHKKDCWYLIEDLR